VLLAWAAAAAAAAQLSAMRSAPGTADAELADLYAAWGKPELAAAHRARIAEAAAGEPEDR
jgi:hypothetical protein